MHQRRVYAGVIAAATWFALASPAVAGLHNAIPADAIGDPNELFVDNDALFAYTTSDIKGGYVCIVPRDAAPSVTCDASAWGGKTRVVGIGTQYTLIEFGLAPGAWRLQTVDSEGENGEAGGEFFVRPCEEEDGDCDNAISLEAASRAKAAARDLGLPFQIGCIGYAVHDAVTASFAARSKLKDYKQRHADYRSGAVGFEATIVPVAGGLLGLAFSLPTLDNPGEEKAKAILKDLVCSLSEMYSDIAADPPDPDFTSVAQPTFSNLPTLSNELTAALMSALDLQTGYGETMLKSYERYQGAVAAGSTADVYKHAQAAALGRNGQAQVRQMRALVKALRQKATEMDSLPEYAEPLVTAERRDDLAAVYARVRTTGFTIDEIAQLTGLGLTSVQIDAARSQFTPDPAVLPLDTTLQSAMRNGRGHARALDRADGAFRPQREHRGRADEHPADRIVHSDTCVWPRAADG